MIPALVTLLQQFDDNERSVAPGLFLKAGGELTALIIFISLVITQIFRPEQLRDPSIGSRGRQSFLVGLFNTHLTHGDCLSLSNGRRRLPTQG